MDPTAFPELMLLSCMIPKTASCQQYTVEVAAEAV